MIEYLGIFIGVSMFTWNKRWKIYNNLIKTRIGAWIVIPFILPYLVYGFSQIDKDPIMVKILSNMRSQKKITDFV